MHRIITALAAGLASGFSSYERKEGCPELYSRGLLSLTISTLGAVETRYDRTGADGVTEIFIPVFEGKAIYVYSFRAEGEPVECLPDETLGCTECGSPGPPGPP